MPVPVLEPQITSTQYPSMTHQEREEIERLIKGVEDCAAAFDPMGKTDKENGVVFAQALLPLTAFARQQLNLRMDGHRLGTLLKERHKIEFNSSFIRILEPLVLECLTTDPLPTKQKED